MPCSHERKQVLTRLTQDVVEKTNANDKLINCRAKMNFWQVWTWTVWLRMRKTSKLPSDITSHFPKLTSCNLPNFSLEALKISAASPSFPKIFSTTARFRCDICASGCSRPKVCLRNVQALWCNAAASGKRPNLAKTLAKLFMEATVSLEQRQNSKGQVLEKIRMNGASWKTCYVRVFLKQIVFSTKWWLRDWSTCQ